MSHTPETGGEGRQTVTSEDPLQISNRLGTEGATGFLDDFLFGVPPSAVFEQMSLLTPEQQAALRGLLGPGGALQAPIPGFEGQLTAGLSNLETTSLAALESEALLRVPGATPGDAGGAPGVAGGAPGQPAPTGFGSATPTQQTALQTLEELLTAGPTDFQDFFRTNVEDPAIKTFNERILPSIQASQASNFFSSERLSQEDRARSDLGANINAERGRFAFATNEASQDRRLAALGLVDSVTGAPVNQAIQLLEAGRVPREVEQAGLTAEYGEFLRIQQAKSQRVEEIIAALNVEGVENFGVGLPGTSGLVSDFFGGGGGDGFLGIFSSREFKEDIEPMDDDQVLTAREGLDISKWNYKGFDTKHIGPIAEEFQEAFGVGDGRTISIIDIMGVTLASQKAMSRRVEKALEAIAEAA